MNPTHTFPFSWKASAVMRTTMNHHHTTTADGAGAGEL